MGVNMPNVIETKPGYFFFRKKVRGTTKYHALPKPSDANFAVEYLKASKVFSKPREESKRGTFGKLVQDYRSSSDYRTKLSDSTRRDYDRYLDMVVEQMGAAPVQDLKSSRVEKMRDRFLDTPGKANNWLKVLRTVLDLGVRRDYITTNVAEKVKMLEIGEHQPWPQDVIDSVLSSCQSQTTALAILTGLYSGQRISDCIRITHAMMTGNTVHLIQHKKRSKGVRDIEVFIPIHPLWRAAVDAVERKTDTIIYDRYGRSFRDPGPLQERIRDIMKSLGYVDESGKAAYTFHGLRKNSTNYLAEMGLTPHEIGALNGMSIETVTLYTRNVQKQRLAENSRERMLSGDVSKQA